MSFSRRNGSTILNPLEDIMEKNALFTSMAKQLKNQPNLAADNFEESVNTSDESNLAKV